MTAAFDPRIVRVTIDINGQVQEYKNVRIDARGTKLRSSQLSRAHIKLYNLTQENTQWILTKASVNAFANQGLTPINTTLEVGRESYGTFALFEGAVVAGNVMQPPDIGIELISMTNAYQLQQTAAINFPETTTLEQIALNLAQALNLTPLIISTNPNRQIVNFYHNGSPLKQLQRLNEMGVVAYIDNTTLVVTDPEQARDSSVTLINNANGLVGVPQVLPNGVLVRTLINPGIQVGGQVQVQSLINPGANGTYIVAQMDFDVSNRDTPFFYSLTCINPGQYFGQQ